MERNKVVLVDIEDNAIGEMEKLLAHQRGELHRAFSVFIFNDEGALLLQKRAANKYHGGGLWTNTCCSHPQWSEDITMSAMDRLYYEMGIKCDLKLIYSFIYNEPVENNLIEHELDYVFIGQTNQNPVLNKDEASDYKWMNTVEILSDINENPSHYTVWFKQAFPELLSKIEL
ncbi:isopentenyl-diphosphate Delta-isomerase [Sphingobacterium sp. SGR-19]|uniref:isopentenyl-diphosphate Delta-isomerase n=1 Tax=Sphingobacterium sp. SGR-19 TaxID=2710886 RepID=UPI0013EC609B|nr:isopentenyl-diphosphate Delta-isomerase [Sphingobacterium sp. SGR-19]NGM66882.1 isopentenyl-diphosphate Delta-isomerase [Sphingobacterium sp. SGR-19]